MWDEVPDNVFIETKFGDWKATDAAFAKADHVIRADFHIDRVTAVTIEPRSSLGHFDAETGRYTLYAGSGGAVRQKNELSKVLGIEPKDLRVLYLRRRRQFRRAQPRAMSSSASCSGARARSVAPSSSQRRGRKPS